MATPEWRPDLSLPDDPRNFWTVQYGLTTYADLFTPRQLVALTTFSNLVQQARQRVQRDAVAAGVTDDDKPLQDGGTGTTAYAEAVGVYLACAVDYAANYWSAIATPADGFIRGTFARQALPMTWDYAEAPPFGSTSGNWLGGIDRIAKALDSLPHTKCGRIGSGVQADAALQVLSQNRVVSTDPPYYDNIGYADLSDFFYVWLRRSLKPAFLELFATLAVPKAEELVASPYRHGSKDAAEAFFLNGMSLAMRPAFRTGASRAPGHNLLRLQAVGDEGGHWNGQHRLGGVSGRRDPIRFRDYRHVADTHRAWCTVHRHRYQCTRFQHRARLPCSPGRCAGHHAPRVRDRAPFGTAAGATPAANRQRRAGRPRPGRHRSRHGGIHPLREGARRSGQGPIRARGIERTQPMQPVRSLLSTERVTSGQFE